MGKGIKVFSEVSQIVGEMYSVTYIKRISSTIYRLNSSLYPRIRLDFISCLLRASLVAQMVKNPPAVHETQVQSLGQEDPLEAGIATHSSVLAWRIPWTEEPGGL